MEATLTHQVMDERRECESYTRACSPGWGGAGRRARAHDMRVNGPPNARFSWADKIGGRGLSPIKGSVLTQLLVIF
jgi:hypothetical protein